MKKNCLKTTVIAASLITGTLMSACANSDGYTKKRSPQPEKLAEGVLVLTPQAEKDLTFSDSGLAVVFAVDKAGKVQAFAKDGSKIEAVKFPLHAEEITQMDTVTTFQTSNPKSCWLSSGTLRCIFW